MDTIARWHKILPFGEKKETKLTWSSFCCPFGVFHRFWWVLRCLSQFSIVDEVNFGHRYFERPEPRGCFFATLRAVGFSYARQERNHCEQPSAFPSSMQEFVTPHVMHLMSISFVSFNCFHCFLLKSILSIILSMLVVRLKRMWTSYHTKNLIMNNSRQKTMNWDDTNNIVPHLEYSVNNCINACSLNEENVDLLSHQESDHEQLKAENNELGWY